VFFSEDSVDHETLCPNTKFDSDVTTFTNTTRALDAIFNAIGCISFTFYLLIYLTFRDTTSWQRTLTKALAKIMKLALNNGSSTRCLLLTSSAAAHRLTASQCTRTVLTESSESSKFSNLQQS